MNMDMDSLFGSLDEVVPAAAAPTVTHCPRCDECCWILELGTVVCSFCGQRQDAPCSEIERRRYQREVAETLAQLNADLPAFRAWLAAERGRAHRKGA
jgi:uncharacterized Zn finger protein (UPF0148 family)